MKNDEIIAIRLPSKLHGAIKREQKRMSRKAGAEVKMSAAVRAILERALLGKSIASEA